MVEIKKRSGEMQEFDRDKLKKAIEKTGANDCDAEKVTINIEKRVTNGISTKEIRDWVYSELRSIPQERTAAENYVYYKKGKDTTSDDVLATGELLWEGNGKTQLMRVKGISADGVEVEFTWYGEIKGVGKAKDVDGPIVFTGTKTATHYDGGKGQTVGYGVFFAADGMVAIKSSGYGNPKWKKNKSIEIWNFSTTSDALLWLNNTVVLVTQEGDSAWKAFKIKIHEWNAKT